MRTFWVWWIACCGLLAGLAGCGSAERPEESGRPAGLSLAAGANPLWERTVAAARQEGKVVISGPTRALWRNEILRFQEDFPGITVEYAGSNSRDFWPRVFREREFGQYLWDLRVGGPDPQVFEAKSRGVLEPIRPWLLLPGVAEEDNWFGGSEGLFFDQEKNTVLGFVNYISFVAYVNHDVVPEAELRSVTELTHPRWRGKIVIQDPRGGAGLTALQTLLKVYGEEMTRDFLKNQDLVVANDQRQQAEWLIRGRYPIAVGITPDAFLAFEDQGMELNIQPLADGGVAVSTGTGGIQFFRQAPHPNVAAVFINWLLTRPVQERLSAATRQNSRRVDVPVAHPMTAPDPARMEQYFPCQVEEALPVRHRAQELAAEWLP